MELNEILKNRRGEILRIARSHGASDLRLFGSLARGEKAPNSDIDILVKLKPKASLLDLIAMKHELEDLLQCKVDLVTEDALSPYIREQVLQETVAL